MRVLRDAEALPLIARARSRPGGRRPPICHPPPPRRGWQHRGHITPPLPPPPARHRGVADSESPRGRTRCRGAAGARSACRSASSNQPTQRRMGTVAGAAGADLSWHAHNAPTSRSLARRLAHLFPQLPKQSGYFKRRRRPAETLEWLMGMFASQTPGVHQRSAVDRLDSAPARPATAKRSNAAPWQPLRTTAGAPRIPEIF
jgi:hypothetical protein